MPSDLDNNQKSDFWNRVTRSDNEDSCWVWNLFKDKDGYGKIGIKGKLYRSHRVAYALTHNLPLVFKGHVLHTCDNPSCCNPNHLWLGTHQDNMTDMKEKRRSKNGSFRGMKSGSPQKGEKNYNAKLTSKDIEEIKLLLQEKLTNKEIAKRYGVTHQAISCIKRGISWG
jgi:HNH endonuclease